MQKKKLHYKQLLCITFASILIQKLTRAFKHQKYFNTRQNSSILIKKNIISSAEKMFKTSLRCQTFLQNICLQVIFTFRFYIHLLQNICLKNENLSFYNWAGDWLHINSLHVTFTDNRAFSRNLVLRSKEEQLHFIFPLKN